MIYFLHIHKSVGSTFINLAINNGEILHHPNENGNPYDENGKLIPFWDFSYDELHSFTTNKKYTLIANEAHLIHFHKMEHLKYLSIIRHPIDIIISNYYHQILKDYIPLEDYLTTDSLYIKHPLTYYFSGKDDSQLALDRALQFDYLLRKDNIKEDIKCMVDFGWTKFDTDRYRIGTRRNTNSVQDLGVDLYKDLEKKMQTDIELYNELNKRIENGKKLR